MRWSWHPPADLESQETFIAADLANRDQVVRAVAGVDAIVHLGGFSVEARARELGYQPQRRAEDFADSAMAAQQLAAPDPIADAFQGGGFCSLEMKFTRGVAARIVAAAALPTK